MSTISVSYNAQNKTVYAVTGTSHMGQGLDMFIKEWDAVIFGKNLVNFNCILDITNMNLDAYDPDTVAPSPDPEKYGYEVICTRKRGNGKFLIVIDPEKGYSPIFESKYNPDGVFYSKADAENFLRTGEGITREALPH